jgi:hypothetical protein
LLAQIAQLAGELGQAALKRVSAFVEREDPDDRPEGENQQGQGEDQDDRLNHAGERCSAMGSAGGRKSWQACGDYSVTSLMEYGAICLSSIR